MTQRDIDLLWIKKEKLHSKLEIYQTLSNGIFNTKNYSKHIERAVIAIHKVNDILYKECNIDRKSCAL